MNTLLDFDIVLPAYNPSLNWEKVIVDNINRLNTIYPNINFNLYITNDGSTQGYSDNSKDYIKKNIENTNFLFYEDNKGKGYALRYAISQCKSPYIIYTDYDFPYTDDSFCNVVDALIDNADVVVAVRDRSYQKSLPTFRKFLSYSSHTINKILFRIKINDTQGGMKGFNTKGKEIFLNTTINTFLFDTQFIYKATHTQDINLVQVPAKIRDGIKMSVMGSKVMLREIKNIFVILFN